MNGLSFVCVHTYLPSHCILHYTTIHLPACLPSFIGCFAEGLLAVFSTVNFAKVSNEPTIIPLINLKTGILPVRAH